MITPLPPRAGPARLRPWLTFAMVAVCAGLYLLNLLVAHRRLAAAVDHLEEAARFHAARPYLSMSPTISRILGAGARAAPTGEGANEYAALEQAEFDGLTRTAVDAVAQTPQGRWGLTPARLSVPGFVTHVFLHASLLPLLANLLLLYLLAPFLEEAWGAPALGGFLLLAGAAGGGVFVAGNPGLELPLVGTSGAAAAVVGAVAARFWGRRLPFRVLVSRRGDWATVSCASWVPLLPWALRAGLSSLGGDVIAPAGAGGLALWAHAGGFVFGVGAAGAALRFRLEERWLGAPPPPAGPAEHWPPVRVDGGRPRKARDAEGEEPAGGGDPGVLVREHLRAGLPADAYDQWRRWREEGNRGPLARALEIRLAEELLRVGDRGAAAAVARGALERAGQDTPTAALSKLVALVEPGDRGRVAALLLGRRDLPEGERPQMEIWAASAPLPGPPASSPASAPASAPRRGNAPGAPAGGLTLAPSPATPLELRGESLVLDLGGGPRALSLERIRALAAAAVDDGTAAEPNLILDVFLEAVPAAGGAVKVLRVESFRWDPRSLVPTEAHPEDAFLSFAGGLLARSGASWLLGGSPRQLPRYRSPEAYEQSLLSVLRLSLGPGAAR